MLKVIFFASKFPNASNNVSWTTRLAFGKLGRKNITLFLFMFGFDTDLLEWLFWEWVRSVKMMFDFVIWCRFGGLCLILVIRDAIFMVGVQCGGQLWRVRTSVKKLYMQTNLKQIWNEKNDVIWWYDVIHRFWVLWFEWFRDNELICEKW